MTAALVVFLVALVFLVVYLFLVMPRVIDKADMEVLRCDYAHRGLWSKDAPENSLKAFELAARAGFGIEFDIQLTKDKRVVVFHDYTLERMCGVKAKVSDLTLAELKRYRLMGSNETIPTLIEVLHLVNGRVPLLVELKGESRDTSLCPRAARILDNYPGAFCIESFNPAILAWFKSFRPRYARGQLVTDLIKSKKEGSKLLNFALTHLLLNFMSRPDFIAVDKEHQGNISFKICASLLRADAFVWTVREPCEFIDAHRSGKRTIFEKIRPRII